MNAETIEWELLIPAGEKVLWCGRPRYGFYSLILSEIGFVKKVDQAPVDVRVLYMYGLLLGGGILFLLGWAWWTILWGVMLLQVFFLMDFWRYYCASKTHYAYTGQAVYLYTFGWKGKRLHRIPMGGLWSLKYVEWPDGHGEIYFFCTSDPPVISTDFRTGNTRFNPTFDQIPEVRTVYQDLRKVWNDIPKDAKQERDDTEANARKAGRVRRSMVVYAVLFLMLSLPVVDYFLMPPMEKDEKIIRAEMLQSGKMDRTIGVYTTETGCEISNDRFLYQDYTGQVANVRSSQWFDITQSVRIGEREYFIGSHKDGLNRIMWLMLAYWALIGVFLLLHFFPGVGLKKSDLLLQIHIVSVVLSVIFGMFMSIVYYLRV